MRLKTKRNYNTSKQSFQQRAFSHVADGSRHGVYTREGEVSKEASLSDASLGKQRKEPRFFFTFIFHKQNSGFYLFTGYELRGVLWKK